VEKRKKNYKINIWQGDYFLIKELNTFIKNSLKENIRLGSIVLDIGCGEQPFRDYIEECGGSYLGVDVNQNAENNVDIIANATDLKIIKTESIDIVLCTEVFEHIDMVDLAFAEICRVLKKEGVLILTSPFIYPLHEEPYDFIRLTPFKIKEMSQKNGTEIIIIEKLGNVFKVCANLIDNAFLRSSKDSFALKLVSALSKSVLNYLAIIFSFLFLGKNDRRIYSHNVAIIKKK